MTPDLFNIDTAILTGRCVIRRFREGDGVEFYQLVSQNRSYLEDHFPRLLRDVGSREEAEAFVRYRLADWLLQNNFAFGVWRRKEADLIGFIHLNEIDWSVPVAEIAYFLDHDFTGQGFMTETVARIIEFAFKQLQLDKLRLRTLSDNFASQRLARRVGFRREGDLRGEFRNSSGVMSDLMLLGLTREEYGM